MKKYELEELEILREFMKRMKSSFPTDDSGYACMYCDMGDAGYSVMGPGTHDNSCPYRTIQCYDEMFGEKSKFYKDILEE